MHEKIRSDLFIALIKVDFGLKTVQNKPIDFCTISLDEVVMETGYQLMIQLRTSRWDH